MVLLAGGLLLVAAARPARASLNEGLLKLRAGKRDCRNKRFASGVKQILDSAVIIQRADPKHRANRQWLPAIRVCLRSWVAHVGRRCRRQGEVSTLRSLQTIQKKVKYLAVPRVKRLIKRQRPRCAAHIVRHQVKACLQAPHRGQLTRLKALRSRLRGFGVGKRPLSRLDRGVTRCARRWVKDIASRCRTNATVDNLKELGAGLEQIPEGSRARARAAYENCAQNLGKRAWSICQSRRYRQGRRLLKEAIDRYGFYQPKNRRFLAKMKRRWLPRCGTWYAKGYFKGRVRRGGTSFKLSAKVGIELTRTGKGNQLQGEMRIHFDAVNGHRSGCRVLITPRDGRYSLHGSERPGKTLKLVLEKGMPQTPALEEVQVTCGDKTPDLSKTRLMHRLVRRAGLFSLSLKARPGARKTFRWRGSLGGGAKGSVAGTLVVKRLK
jgi:hypothetical protein